MYTCKYSKQAMYIWSIFLDPLPRHQPTQTATHPTGHQPNQTPNHPPNPPTQNSNKDLNGIQHQFKMTSMEDDLEGRRHQWKTASMEDNFNERQLGK